MSWRTEAASPGRSTLIATGSPSRVPRCTWAPGVTTTGSSSKLVEFLAGLRAPGVAQDALDVAGRDRFARLALGVGEDGGELVGGRARQPCGIERRRELGQGDPPRAGAARDAQADGE